MVLRRDDAVFEDDVDGGERHPAEEDQRKARKRRLQRGAEREELHPPFAADVDLPFWERRMQPRPYPLNERLGHAVLSLRRAFCANPDYRHFT